MDSNALDKLWHLADHQQEHGRFSLPELLKEAQAAQIDVSVSDLQAFMQKMPSSYSSIPIFPDWLIEFIVAYIKDRDAKSILDPWASSLLLIPLTKSIQPDITLGLISSKEVFEVASLLSPQSNISWILQNLTHQPLELTQSFDVVVSFLPFGPPNENITLPSYDGPVVFKDCKGAIILLQSCIRLNQNGVALFVVMNNFMWFHKPHSVYTNLSKFDLVVHAALSLPEGTFSPYTSIPTTLLIIKRVQADKLFVGELSSDQKRNTELLKNLNSHRAGPELPLGALVEPTSYHSYSSLVSQYKAQELIKRLGIKPVKLADVALQINLTKATEYPGFQEIPNSIYVPLIGHSKVVTSLSQATLKRPFNYIQIVLDPDKAVALYVANFFNTSLGQPLREQLLTGLHIPKITKKMISQTQMYLPDRETQIKTIEADTKIENLISILKSLQDRAWSQPRQLKQALHDIEMVNREERFSDWLDTLPFPLASILWTYHTSGDDQKRRYELLLKFFEATAEFLATILLSGFKNDEELFHAKQKQLQDIFSRNPIGKSTFGTWVGIAESLAKEGRTMLNGNLESKCHCKEMFRTQDEDILEVLFSKEIISLLQEANERRNEWVGHGGIVSSRDAQNRHTTLENHLSKLRRNFSTKWENYQLIKAGSSEYISGVYHYDVECILGRSTPFEKKKVKTDVPLDLGLLFLLSPAEQIPLKLLPLITITEQNACYFYNRLQSEQIRFVSYHFEEVADITEPLVSFKDTVEAIQMITSDIER